MLVPFTSSEAASRDFHEMLTIGAISILAMVVTAIFASRSKSPILRVKTIAVLGLLGFGFVVAFSYSSTFGRFISAEITDSDVRLHYVGPLSSDVVLPRGSVETILFGIPSKTNHSCYISIHLKSGERYRSATLQKQPEVCKSLRANMLAALFPPGET